MKRQVQVSYVQFVFPVSQFIGDWDQSSSVQRLVDGETTLGVQIDLRAYELVRIEDCPLAFSPCSNKDLSINSPHHSSAKVHERVNLFERLVLFLCRQVSGPKKIDHNHQ
jgi:hypothetical protein